jgi:hypothetical protein
MGKAGHKELQWMLLSLCGTRSSQHRKFMKPGKGQTKNRLETALSEIYPLLKYSDIELLVSLNTKAELVELFKDRGYEDSVIKEIFKNIDKE